MRNLDLPVVVDSAVVVDGFGRHTVVPDVVGSGVVPGVVSSTVVEV